MPGIWADLTRQAETIRRAAAGAGVCAVVAGGAYLIWLRFRARIPPEELERRRREAIHARGKIGDAEIIDVEGAIITYAYSVGGVEYTVAQDAGALEPLLPEDRMRMVGPASVRYDPKNPPNSIVLCEHWSGLRLRGISPPAGEGRAPDEV